MKFKPDALQRVVYRLLFLGSIFSWLGALLLVAYVVFIFIASVATASASVESLVMMMIYMVAIGLNIFVAVFLNDVRSDMVVNKD